MKDLTAKQKAVLDIINEYIEKNGYAPSVRDICEITGLRSTSTVHGYINRIQSLGYLSKETSKTRTLRVSVPYKGNNEEKSESIKEKSKQKKENAEAGTNIIEKNNKEYIEVPVMGKVAAGIPILAVENVIDTFALPMDFAKNKELFMLMVKGDSMINAGIHDGDCVVISKQKNVQNGDIVVALLNEEVTLKRFYKEKGHIRLQPENDNMQPIIIKDDLDIMGKAVGLFRRF